MANLSLIRSLIVLLAIFNIENIAIAQTNKEELKEILKNQNFDDFLVENKINNTTYQGTKFAVDETGIFYKENSQGRRFPLDIYISPHSKNEFIIFDPNKPPIAELPNNPWAVPKNKEFDDLVSRHRLYGIFNIKNKNPECYFAYAAERLGPSFLDRLLALERPKNPRPLIFESDNDWDDFKKDIKNLFSAFKGQDSFVVIIGTSTTFFSENPRKGKNAPLFESTPNCLNRAKDPVARSDVYTFDTPGAEASDLDIDILIPEISTLCNNASASGNDGQRDAYFENTMDKCLRVSPSEAVRNLVIPVAGSSQTLKAASPPDKPFGQFLSKWTDKLKRVINFSVIIRPDQRKGGLFKPEKDFNKESYLKRRFVIPID